jgi:hypothetical protein
MVNGNHIFEVFEIKRRALEPMHHHKQMLPFLAHRLDHSTLLQLAHKLYIDTIALFKNNDLGILTVCNG